ncbi:uncharacterized protein DDB_G0285291-like [Zootermopsis nevadensis]|uniref:Uncharacterized protein n=1 Tax=Zootermopsis nevadensis TaxID=136037 RepID=A0A067RIV7_ZOONE|nr:uncharacterized protein DDB_G0285291-like [Zootermopsis nevadensis]KDR23801.1 hypothetical protein L798_11379 [Zootermopsis nevadensis]
MIVHTAILFILLSADFTLGTEKQVKLEDIEQDNLKSKQAQPHEANPSVADYTVQQQLNYQAQQQQTKQIVPDYTVQQQLNYQAQQQQAKPIVLDYTSQQLQQAKPIVLDYTSQQLLNYQAQQQQTKPIVPDYTSQQLLNYQPQQQQQQAKPIVPDYTIQQQLNYQAQQQQAKPIILDYTSKQQEQGKPIIPDYTGQQQQISLQPTGYQHGLQPQLQFQAPPSGSPVALYLAGNGLAGNYLGITPDVAYQSLSQQFYLPQSGYSGLQFVQVPHSPFIYNHQPASPKPPQVAHSPIQKAIPTANLLSSHISNEVRPAYQRPSAASAGTNFIYTQQQAYNPIPKELQSYTTIPDTVYQGKEPDTLYDQQPSVSITHDGLNQYNALFQQPKPQRPTFSSGVKSTGLSSIKTIPNGGRFLANTRNFPGFGISYSNYRQGPGAF